jgi:hypothetical protein
MSPQDTDSLEEAQNEILTGKKREPEHAAIKRHQNYQYEMRHGKGLICFLLVRATMIFLGVVSAAVGFYFMLWSATWFILASGLVCFFGGLFLAFRGLLGKRVTLSDVFYYFS